MAEKLMQPPVEETQEQVTAPMPGPAQAALMHERTGVPYARKPGIPGTVDFSSGRETPYSPWQQADPWAAAFAHSANIHNPIVRTMARVGSLMGAAVSGGPAGQKMMESRAEMITRQQEAQQKLAQQQAEHEQDMQQKAEQHELQMNLQRELLATKGKQATENQETKDTQQVALENQKAQHQQEMENLKENFRQAMTSGRPDDQAWQGYLKQNAGDPVKAWEQYQKDKHPVDPLLSSLRQQQMQDKLDETAATNASTSLRAQTGLQAQDNYRNTYHAWQKTGNFAKDSGLITEQLGEGASGLRSSVSEGLGLLTRDPAVAVGAAAAGAVISSVSKTLDGYLDTLKKQGISPEGYAAMMAYRNALVGRLIFEAGQMKGSASVLRLREVADQFLKQVPVPTTPAESFDSSMDLYYPAMKQQLDILQKKRGGAITAPATGPGVGTVRTYQGSTYKFKGGDWHDKNNWVKQ